MKNRLKTCLILCVFYLGNAWVSHAQENDTEENGSRFRVTLFNEWGGPQLYVKTTQSYLPLEAYQMAYTKAFRYPSDKPISLYAKLPSEDSTEEYKAYLTVQVPQSLRVPLLVLYWRPEENTAGGKVVEFSSQKFRYGSYQIVNLSKEKIIGYLGDKKNVFSCEPQSCYISPFSFKNGERTAIVAFISQNDEPDLVYSTLTIHRQRKRVILFLNAETNKLGRLVYRSRSLVDFQRL